MALREGLKVAEALHAQQQWNPAADPHMYTHAVRRQALEVIKAANFDARPEDNLGAAMSGLHLTVDDTDVIRVWHGYDGRIRLPSSDAGREYLNQPSTAQLLPGFGSNATPRVCKTILLWDHASGELTRFKLLRPVGFDRGDIKYDWDRPLLQHFSQRMDDITFRPRMPEAGEESETS